MSSSTNDGDSVTIEDSMAADGKSPVRASRIEVRGSADQRSGRRQSIAGINLQHHDLPMRGTLRNMIQTADKDGDGKISMSELTEVMEQALQEAESKRQYRRGALVLVVVVLILIGSMGAMSAAVAYSLKDTEAAGAILASRDNKVMQTGRAEYLVPLLVAPVLPSVTLASVQTITLTIQDAAAADGKYESFEQVKRVRRYSKVRVTFDLVSGDELHVWDGEAYLQPHGGDKVALCKSDVSCAAFSVDDARSAEAYMEEAQAALKAEGLTMRRLRQLTENGEECSAAGLFAGEEGGTGAEDPHSVSALNDEPNEEVQTTLKCISSVDSCWPFEATWSLQCGDPGELDLMTGY